MRLQHPSISEGIVAETKKAGGKTRVSRPHLSARELGRLAGVSESAVSRAFNPGASISQEMRDRILAMAEKHGYRPNAIARMLSQSRSNIVGIVVSDLRNPFYPLLIEKLSRALQEVGLQSLLFNVTPGSDVEEQMMALRQYYVDAVIIISATVLNAAELAFATAGRAAIVVNRFVPEADFACVLCDNTLGAYAVADHFQALGRKRVAYVSGLARTHTALERQFAFVSRLAQHGMTLTGSFSAGEYSYEAGYRTALEIARTTDTDAIFFVNDILAVGGMDALRDKVGLRVPEDIAVAGFDDIAMAAWPHYDLTTYRKPVAQMVETVISLLLKRAEDGTMPSGNYMLPGELIVRSSTQIEEKADAVAR